MTRTVIPAKAGIQYSRASAFYRSCCGVLDARLRGHDGNVIIPFIKKDGGHNPAVLFR